MTDNDFIRFLAISLLFLLGGRGTTPANGHPGGDVSAYLLLTSSASILLRPTTAQQVNKGISVSLECFPYMEGLIVHF